MINRTSVTVEVKQVVIVESRIGEGTVEPFDPIRPFIQVFDMDGKEINTGDYTNYDQN